MLAVTTERPKMAKSPGASVRIAEDLLPDARFVAAGLGKTIGQYISDVLREAIQHDLAVVIARKTPPAKAAPKGKPKGK